jgi:hypothetical protein
MRIIKPRINRTGCTLLIIFLFLISLIGCAGPIIDKGIPVIDKVSPGTPKGFVEFYAFSGDYYERKHMGYDCYDLQKARTEYSNLAINFAVKSDQGFYMLVKDPKVYRPKDFPLELELPSYWRRFAMAPGEHNFLITAGKNPILLYDFISKQFPVKVTEGMITLIRLEAKCIKSKGGVLGIESLKGSLDIVRSEQIPITSNEKSIALLKQFLNDSDWTIRFYAARILGEIDDPNTAELLIEALRDDIWEVRMQAAFSLVKFKNVRDVRIIDLITKALIEDSKGDNLDQMRHTARLLGAIGDERVIAPLERCLDKKYDPIYLKEELGRVGTLHLQQELSKVKTECSDALKKIRQRINK